MLSEMQVKVLKEALQVRCGMYVYNPEIYLQKGLLAHLSIVYTIFEKRYTFTIPLFLFEYPEVKTAKDTLDNSNELLRREYAKQVKVIVEEIRRNVELAHKREERILL